MEIAGSPTPRGQVQNLMARRDAGGGNQWFVQAPGQTGEMIGLFIPGAGPKDPIVAGFVLLLPCGVILTHDATG